MVDNVIHADDFIAAKKVNLTHPNWFIHFKALPGGNFNLSMKHSFANTGRPEEPAKLEIDCDFGVEGLAMFGELKAAAFLVALEKNLQPKFLKSFQHWAKTAGARWAQVDAAMVKLIRKERAPPQKSQDEIDRIEKKINDMRVKAIGKMKADLNKTMKESIQADVDAAIAKTCQEATKKTIYYIENKKLKPIEKAISAVFIITVATIALTALGVTIATGGVAGAAAIGIASVGAAYGLAKLYDGSNKLHEVVSEHRKQTRKGLDNLRDELKSAAGSIQKAIDATNHIDEGFGSLVAVRKKLRTNLGELEKAAPKNPDKKLQIEKKIGALHKQIEQIEGLMKIAEFTNYKQELVDALDIVKEQARIVTVEQATYTKRFMELSKNMLDFAGHVSQIV